MTGEASLVIKEELKHSMALEMNLLQMRTLRIKLKIVKMKKE